MLYQTKICVDATINFNLLYNYVIACMSNFASVSEENFLSMWKNF